MEGKQTVILANCRYCSSGKLELRPSAFHLTIFSTGEGNYYTFFCPSCTEENRWPAQDAVCNILMKVGVATSEVEVPLEILEHPPEDAPAISVDDVMEFVVALRGFGRLLDSQELL